MTPFPATGDGPPHRSFPLPRGPAAWRAGEGVSAAVGRCVVLLEMEPGPRRDFAAAALQNGGATVIATVTGQPLRNLDAVFASQVVVLDAAAVACDSLEICRWLATVQGPPVMLLMASDYEGDRIAGLENGADDCVPSSTSALELLTRVFALARRHGPRPAVVADGTRRVSFSGWSFRPDSGELRTPTGRTEFLSPADVLLLSAFVEHPRQILPLRDLAAMAGGEHLSDVDWRVRISRLRSRLDRLDGGGSLIQTVQRKGYVLAADCLWDPS